MARSPGLQRVHASPRQQAVMSLLQTTDELRRYFSAFYEPYGITSQQYNVLRILRGAGPEGLATMEIADRMVEKTPGITRLIDRLEEKRLIERQPAAHDRRQRRVVLGASGEDLLEELEAPVKGATESAVAMLKAAEVKGLSELLERIRMGLSSGSADE